MAQIFKTVPVFDTPEIRTTYGTNRDGGQVSVSFVRWETGSGQGEVGRRRAVQMPPQAPTEPLLWERVEMELGFWKLIF